ncbi:GNAT family N-acetyltransferase [Ruania albidiflava]|uniref:GNAT family N-acetyltransferase n=1 Tax=Ruania albidiflava TaxID=366586 RepID=UPI0003B446E2|nr:GNAT family N-acetyltransferase [Ruania albidiflava]
MTISYRPWQEGDEVAARERFGEPDTPQSALDRPLLGPDAPDPWRRCLVALDGDRVVAAGAVSEARLHPTRLWLYVEVAPTHRRQGIATQLVRRLRQEAAPSAVTALRSRYTTENPAAAAFARALGMQPIQRTRIARIEAGGLPEPMFGPAGPVLEDLATGSVELTKLVAAYYDRVHASWDPAEMTLGRAQDLLLAPQTGAHGAVVLRDRAGGLGGSVLAFAISYPAATEEDDAAPRRDTELLLGYDTELAPARARAAVRQLLAMVTARYPVLLEVDDAMAPVSDVVDALLGEELAQVVTESTLVALDEGA